MRPEDQNIAFLNAWVDTLENVSKEEYDALYDICLSNIEEADVVDYCRIKHYPKSIPDLFGKLLDHAANLNGGDLQLVNQDVAFTKEQKNQISGALFTVMNYVMDCYEGNEPAQSSAFLESFFEPEEALKLWDNIIREVKTHTDSKVVTAKVINTFASKLV